MYDPASLYDHLLQGDGIFLQYEIPPDFHLLSSEDSFLRLETLIAHTYHDTVRTGNGERVETCHIRLDSSCFSKADRPYRCIRKSGTTLVRYDTRKRRHIPSITGYGRNYRQKQRKKYES